MHRQSLEFTIEKKKSLPSTQIPNLYFKSWAGGGRKGEQHEKQRTVASISEMGKPGGMKWKRAGHRSWREHTCEKEPPPLDAAAWDKTEELSKKTFKSLCPLHRCHFLSVYFNWENNWCTSHYQAVYRLFSLIALCSPAYLGVGVIYSYSSDLRNAIYPLGFLFSSSASWQIFVSVI